MDRIKQQSAGEKFIEECWKWTHEHGDKSELGKIRIITRL